VAAIDDGERAVRAVQEAAGRSVVRIGRGPGRGGGIVLAEGLLLTNAHNLRGREVTVTFPDGRAEVGSVAGVDVDGDLAVVGADTAGAPALEWRDPEVALGAAVFTLTAPPSAPVRITAGRVSAVGRGFRGPRGRLIPGGLEHTAPLPRGSSGSPLLDADGRLVGINTHRLGEGFYLAVPADATLRTRVDALARGESPRRLYLGVSLLPAHAGRRLRASVGLPERDGLLVRAVDDDGPAARAGVRAGDLLVAAGGAPLGSHDDLFDALGHVGEGEALHLTVVRGTDELEVRVSFGAPAGEGSGSA
jgi:serine protease Do